MKRQSKSKGFDIEVNNRVLRISRENKGLTLSHGEGTKLAEIGGILQKMRRLPVYPPYIESSPFKAALDENSITISHQSRESSGLPLEWSELDDFVEAVYSLLKIALDMLTLSGKQPIVSSGGFSSGLDH